MHTFLPRDSYAKRGIFRRRVSVRLFVCVCLFTLLHFGIV